jgi:long-chain acyl-CoA synthetase
MIDYSKLEFATINDVFERMSHQGETQVAMFKTGSEWKEISSQQMYGRVRALVGLLQQWGIKRGERVGLVSENRWEWPVVDFAVLAIGAVDVPLYETLTPEQMGYILRDAGVRAVIVSNKLQYKKLVAAGEIPTLEFVAVLDEGEFDGATSLAGAFERAKDLESVDAGFDALLKETRPEDLATIVYTSGTTGDPKGVMLTHRNLADNLRYSTVGLRIGPGDVTISFLPLSHSLARHLGYAIYGHGGKIAYLAKFDDLRGAMQAVKPQIFLAVPRVYEKIRQGTEAKSVGFKKKILHWAMGQGKKHRKELMAGKTPSSPLWKLADKLVYSKLREAFGGKAKIYVSGGAPLGMDSAEWFLNMGIRIFEGYGLTETSPVISRNTYDGYRIGTVGMVIPNLELRMAEDGEIEVRGTTVFSGYWEREEATKAEFTEDGWFKTGDIGKYEDGFLSITDRKKELIKTSSGKYIAPQPIEGKLKADELVGNAAVIGDSRKFAAVLISPDFQALGRWAGEHGVAAKDPKELVKDPKVKAQYESIVKRVNAELQDHERMKKVGVMPEEWSIEGGELTPSMKLKRRVIFDRYKDRIDALYGGE